jgi:hypothetical protein
VAAIDLNRHRRFRGNRRYHLCAQRIFHLRGLRGRLRVGGTGVPGGFCFGLLLRGCSGSLPAIPYAKAGPALNRRVLSQSPRTMSIVIFIIFYFFLGARFSLAGLSSPYGAAGGWSLTQSTPAFVRGYGVAGEGHEGETEREPRMPRITQMVRNTTNQVTYHDHPLLNPLNPWHPGPTGVFSVRCHSWLVPRIGCMRRMFRRERTEFSERLVQVCRLFLNSAISARVEKEACYVATSQ